MKLLILLGVGKVFPIGITYAKVFKGNTVLIEELAKKKAPEVVLLEHQEYYSIIGKDGKITWVGKDFVDYKGRFLEVRPIKEIFIIDWHKIERNYTYYLISTLIIFSFLFVLSLFVKQK